MKSVAWKGKSLIMVLAFAMIMTFSFGVMGADAATGKMHLKETKIVLAKGEKIQ